MSEILLDYSDLGIVQDNQSPEQAVIVNENLRLTYGLPETDSMGFRYFELTPARLDQFVALRTLDPETALPDMVVQTFRDCLAEELEDMVTSPMYVIHPDDTWPTFPERLRMGERLHGGTQLLDKFARICNDAQVEPSRFSELTENIFEID